MQTIIPIDIYGKCSKRLNIRRRANTDEQSILSHEEQNVLSLSKFYIAFENARCPEYVTEKLYKITNLQLTDTPPVPIVMGPNKSWYAEHLPEKSFIHVDDFQHPEEMGRYLWNLHFDNDKFLEYVQWRRYHKLVRNPPLRCKLCEVLLKDTITQQANLVISDFEAFWKRADCTEQK